MAPTIAVADWPPKTDALPGLASVHKAAAVTNMTGTIISMRLRECIHPCAEQRRRHHAKRSTEA